MYTLTRHVLAELLKVFAIALTGLTTLMLIVGLARELLMTQGLPVTQVVQLMPFLLPEALCAAIPVTLLLATTTVFARMSSGNEVVAVKALGISPMVLLSPALVMGFLLSLATCFFYDLSASWGRSGLQRVAAEALQEILYGMLRTHRSYSIPGRFTIHVRQVEGDRLKGLSLTTPPSDHSPGVIISAETAWLHCEPARNVMRVELRNGSVDVQGRMSFQFPGYHEQEIPLPEPSNAKDTAKASLLALRSIPDQVIEQRRDIRKFEQELAARATYQMLGGNFAGLFTDVWNKHYLAQLREKRSHLYRLLTEPYRRWATGFSCLLFVWVGAPMAIRLRNGDFLTSFFLCFSPILVVYYPLLIYGVDGAKEGTIPPWSVWAGNLLLAVWGAWLLRRVVRY